MKGKQKINEYKGTAMRGRMKQTEEKKGQKMDVRR
jgi:hypothetical protein